MEGTKFLIYDFIKFRRYENSEDTRKKNVLKNILSVFGKEIELERLDPGAVARLSDHPVINDRGSFPRRIDDRLILCRCNYSTGAICCALPLHERIFVRCCCWNFAAAAAACLTQYLRTLFYTGFYTDKGILTLINIQRGSSLFHVCEVSRISDQVEDNGNC